MTPPESSSNQGDWLERVWEAVDPRLRSGLEERLREQAPGRPSPERRPTSHVVLAGHRAAGKSRLLPLLADRLGLPAVDLDHHLEREHGCRLLEWVRDDEPGFRRAEREAFAAQAPPKLIAVGGGFLALHPERLAGHLVVLVPLSFESYQERLRADTTRPRLRPDLSLDDELREVFAARERLHAQVEVTPLVDLLRLLVREPA